MVSPPTDGLTALETIGAAPLFSQNTDSFVFLTYAGSNSVAKRAKIRSLHNALSHKTRRNSNLAILALGSESIDRTVRKETTDRRIITGLLRGGLLRGLEI